VRRQPWLPLALIVLATAVAGARASDPILLTEAAGGILELEGERRLEVSGFQGSITLRLGKVGELRFAARNLQGERVERPIALWLENSTLRIVPVDDAPAENIRLEVSLSPTLSARVEASNSKVHIAGLHGEVQVRGEELDLTVRSVDGSVELEIERGLLLVERVAEELKLTGSELDVQVDHVSGAVTLSLQDSSIECNHTQGEFDADLDDTDLSVSNATGRIRVEANRGSLGLSGCKGGAELFLSETPLGLYLNEGQIDVDTDAEVTFEGHNGQLNIRGMGSAVHGTNSTGGETQIETSRAEVFLEGLEGSAVIRGADLQIHVKDSKGDLTVITTGSTIVVESPQTAVFITNDFGDVRVDNASKLVKIDNRDGEVRLFGMKGQVQVKSEGPEVEVHWVSLGGAETSSVENSRGDVRVSLPLKFRCRIDASAPHGRIETEIEDLRVSDDGHHATGILLGGRRAAAALKKPTIRLSSGGDIYIETTDPLLGRP